MPKPQVEKRDAFSVTPGTFIRLPSGNDEVVRAVSVVLSMANGEVLTYQDGDEIPVLVEQPSQMPERSVEGRRTTMDQGGINEPPQPGIEIGAAKPSAPDKSERPKRDEATVPTARPRSGS